MIVTNSAYIVLKRENDIVISASDMNVVLITILSRPYLRCMDAAIPICLPGIASDGFLYFTIKYITPNIGIIFGCLTPDSFFECLAKANDICHDLDRKSVV